MQVLIAIIEKTGTEYIARCPNLPGVSITADTYDGAQDAIIEAVEKRYNQIHGMHAEYKSVSRRPIAETVSCVYKYTDGFRKGRKCLHPAQKEGLCQIHWKMFYSHAFGAAINLKACPLCGESDRDVLKSWDSPCSFKAENPDWRDVLEERKVTMRSSWAKERKQFRLESLGDSPRCTVLLKNGERCIKASDYGGKCMKHELAEYL